MGFILEGICCHLKLGCKGLLGGLSIVHWLLMPGESLLVEMGAINFGMLQ